MPRVGETMPQQQRDLISASLRARGMTPTKRCPQCGETKDRGDFGVRTNGYSRSWCRACEIVGVKGWIAANQDRVRATNRRTTLKRWHGITEEQYDALLAAQDGVCAICGGVETNRNGFLNVDHCHDSKVIRGLLCEPCNLAIGIMRDDPARLRAAAAYLEQDHPVDALLATPGLPSGRR